MSDNAALLVPTPLRALLILLFCMICGFCDILVSVNKPKPIKWIINYILVLTAFILCVLIPSAAPKIGPFSMIAILVFSITPL